jgi:hypothetical protein
MTENEVFTALPCLSCNNAQSDKVKSVIGAAYLHLERGDTVTVPPREKLLTYCCKNLHEKDGTTFLVPQPTGKIPELQPQPPARAWWR